MSGPQREPEPPSTTITSSDSVKSEVVACGVAPPVRPCPAGSTYAVAVTVPVRVCLAGWAPEAAGALAKNPEGSREAALAAVLRLARAREKPAGNAEADALTSLIALTGPLPDLLPTPNFPLAAALAPTFRQPPQPIFVPAEARASPAARRLRVRTSRGEMVIDLRRGVAPFTSSALAALASRRFYDGLTFHRVVPDFVVQGGDPRGDGDGGPGWALPDEHSPLRFVRGTLGIATSGPETGGSQFFLCHSPQPHLDGRYTVAGQLGSGDGVLDALQPGDTILSITPE